MGVKTENVSLDCHSLGSTTLSPLQSRQRKVSAYVTSLTPPPPITVDEVRSRKASAMPGLMPTKSALKSKRLKSRLSVMTNTTTHIFVNNVNVSNFEINIRYTLLIRLHLFFFQKNVLIN